MNITDIKSITRYRDGGTIAAALHDGTTWYLDGRLNSDTEGQVFSDYPTRPGAVNLEAMSWEVGAITEYARRDALVYNATRAGQSPDFLHLPGFFAPELAQTYFEALRGSNPKTAQDITWYSTLTDKQGQLRHIKRAMAYAVDPAFDKGVYQYADLELPSQGFTPVLTGIRQQLEQFESTAFGYNSVLLNLYINGKQTIGWHSDKEAQLGPAPVIATVNLGATRTFSFREKESGERIDLKLENGDVLMMNAACQQNYLHAILPQKGDVGPRISLTYRKVTLDA
jgi:alkylated DNA repair dioxygenase AlkB